MITHISNGTSTINHFVCVGFANHFFHCPHQLRASTLWCNHCCVSAKSHAATNSHRLLSLQLIQLHPFRRACFHVDSMNSKHWTWGTFGCAKCVWSTKIWIKSSSGMGHNDKSLWTQTESDESNAWQAVSWWSIWETWTTAQHKNRKIVRFVSTANEHLQMTLPVCKVETDFCQIAVWAPVGLPIRADDCDGGKPSLGHSKGGGSCHQKKRRSLERTCSGLILHQNHPIPLEDWQNENNWWDWLKRWCLLWKAHVSSFGWWWQVDVRPECVTSHGNGFSHWQVTQNFFLHSWVAKHQKEQNLLPSQKIGEFREKQQAQSTLPFWNDRINQRGGTTASDDALDHSEKRVCWQRLASPESQTLPQAWPHASQWLSQIQQQ